MTTTVTVTVTVSTFEMCAVEVTRITCEVQGSQLMVLSPRQSLRGRGKLCDSCVPHHAVHARLAQHEPGKTRERAKSPARHSHGHGH